MLQGNLICCAYLVLAQEGKVEQDFQRLSISSHHDELGLTAVKCLGS